MTRYALTTEFERILGTSITERNTNVMTKCPFHEDRHPSLSIDLERGLEVCFQCGFKGNIYKLAYELNEPLDETSVILSTYKHVPDSYEPTDFSDLAEELHENAKRDKPLEIVEYISKRGLSPRVFEAWRLGWTGTAIAMPYIDGETVVALKYRAPNGFKWYEGGSRPGLYGIDAIRGSSHVILAEGESDTHALWSKLAVESTLDKSSFDGINWAVAGVPGVGKGQPSQATWELWALDLFWAKHILVAFDADDAGDAGSVIPMSIFGDRAKRARPTRGKDVADHFMQGGTLDELVGI